MIDFVDIRDLVASSIAANDLSRLYRATREGALSELRQFSTEIVAKTTAGSATDEDRLSAGVVLHLLGRHRDAVEVLQGVPSSAMGTYVLGLSLNSLDRFNDAAEQFELAAKAGFDRVDAMLHRAGALRRCNQFADAEKALRDIARQAVSRAEYSYQMGCVLADQGDRFGAIEYFERAVDMDPHHSAALFRLAVEHDQNGNDDEAIRLYEQSLSTPPIYAGALINLGLLYEDRENYAAASWCFRRVLDQDASNERANLYLKDIEATGQMYYSEEDDKRQREVEQRLLTPITDFELSARSRKYLSSEGIETLGDLTRTTEQELLRGRNFGVTSLREIEQILDSQGLTLGQEAADVPIAPTVDTSELAPEDRAKLDRSVSDLGLTVRSRKCLSRMNITSIGQLIQKSADELLSTRNFGVTSLNEIRGLLSEMDLKLRDE